LADLEWLAAAMSLAPGTQFGPYEIVAPIGTDGMGEIYRARETPLKRDVLIKVVLKHLVKNRDYGSIATR